MLSRVKVPVLAVPEEIFSSRGPLGHSHTSASRVVPNPPPATSRRAVARLARRVWRSPGLETMQSALRAEIAQLALGHGWRERCVVDNNARG